MHALHRIAAFAVVAMAGLGVSAQDTPGYRLAIVNPANDATVFSNPGDVSVQASVVPALAGDDRVELLVDGDSAGEPAKSLDFQLSGMERGEHVLQARVIDGTGNVSAVSPSTIFYVWQASVLFPNQRGR
jgi:hypothetical protein